MKLGNENQSVIQNLQQRIDKTMSEIKNMGK